MRILIIEDEEALRELFTRNQLLNSVWGDEVSLISRTVDAHVTSLRKKLGDQDGYIQTVPKIGHLWEVKA